MQAVLAKKIGMSRAISEETGAVVPVTLLQVGEAEVLTVKTDEKDGYSAVVLGAFPRTVKQKNKNQQFKFVKEVCCEAAGVKVGDSFGAAALEGVAAVKVTGVSKGRGFSGVIKRHNFARGRETHGSHHHREPGSVGMCSKPGRILKGKRLPGQYGAKQVSLRSAKLVQVDADRGLVAVKGAVPGAKNSFVFLSAVSA